MHNLHVYNAEKYIIFNGDFARENFASTGIRTHIFFIQAAPLSGLWPLTRYVWALSSRHNSGGLISTANS